MKTVTVTFPIQEAVEALRLLRGESRCLIEQTENMPDFDTTKRINHVMSARERITTALEEIAETEDTIDAPQLPFNNMAPRMNPRQEEFMDDWLGDELARVSGEEVPHTAIRHGVTYPKTPSRFQTRFGADRFKSKGETK